MRGRVAALAMVACGMWVLSLSLLTLQTITAMTPRLSAWAIEVGLGACVATGWALILNERHRVETIAKMLGEGDGVRQL